MIIGIDCSRAFVGERTGTENYSYYLVKHLLRLPESQVHHFVLFTRPNSILPDWVRQKNVQIKPINFRFLWTQIGLAWTTWRVPLDILWVPAHTLPIFRRPGLRTVVTIHGLEYRWLPEYRNWLQRWYLPLSTFYAAKSADQLIAVSAFTQKQLIEELHTDKKKIKVIQEGVENGNRESYIGDRKAILEKYGLRDKEYLLFVGTVQPRKNIPALIAAFSELSGKLASYRLVIAGAVGWLAEEALAAPRRYGVQERVVWTGRVSEAELAALYQGAALYVQPSLTEGFGLPVVEAMRAGVPVVVSDGGALPEVVGEAGRVVSLNDQFVAQLALTMREAIEHPVTRKKMISMGHLRVREMSWLRAAQATLLTLLG